jgi:hypothetical protein
MVGDTAVSLTTVAISRARQQGCNCHLETRTELLGPWVVHVKVLHDDWCSLVRRGDTN